MGMHPAGARQDLCPPPPEEAALLRQALAAAGFTDKALIAKLGTASLPTARTHNLPRLMRQTSAGEPIDTLARLFLFGMAVPAAAVRAALAPFPLETLCRVGLAELRGGEVTAAAILYPYGPLLMVFDRPEKVLAGAPRDLVMGVTGSTVDLANFTVRAPARNALDLGTGSGFHAFLAAAHAQHVWAADISARAVSFARMGAALSGLSNVECVEGDRFEPVRGLRFDLIVGNLPFVIAPSSRYLYRDGGMRMDAFAESVLRAAPEHLEEGGWCQVICEWAHLAGEDWEARMRRWFEGSGCDVWVLRLSTADPALYAEAWIRETESDDPEAFGQAFAEWTAWYDANRVEAIGTGLIALRRRSGGRNWFHTEEWRDRVPDGFGEYVARRFALYGFLETVADDAGLLESRLTVAPGARLLTTNEWTPGGWRVAEVRLAMDGLAGFTAGINAYAGHLLSFCNGETPLREAVARLAAALGADAGSVSAASLPLVRALIERGFLLPPDAELKSYLAGAHAT
jgi:methylase of polypeptide subunit release factors